MLLGFLSFVMVVDMLLFGAENLSQKAKGFSYADIEMSHASA